MKKNRTEEPFNKRTAMRKAKGRITGGDELVNMKYIAQIKIIYSMNKNLLIISTKAKHFDLVCLLSERKQNVLIWSVRKATISNHFLCDLEVVLSTVCIHV